MKKYRITSTIIDGEHEYPDEIVVSRSRPLSERQACELVAHFWCDPNDSAEWDGFVDELLNESSAMIPGDTRAVTDVAWDEIEPVTVIVRNGMIEDIRNIPENLEIKTVDWDTEGLDTRGRPVPAISLWDSRGEHVLRLGHGRND